MRSRRPDHDLAELARPEGSSVLILYGQLVAVDDPATGLVRSVGEAGVGDHSQLGRPIRLDRLDAEARLEVASELTDHA